MTNFTGNCSNLTNAEALYCLVQNAESFKFQFRKFQALLTIMTVENCWFIQELKKIDFTLYLHKSILYSNIDPPCGFEKTFVKKFSQKMYFFQIVWYLNQMGCFELERRNYFLVVTEIRAIIIFPLCLHDKAFSENFQPAQIMY